MATRSRRPTQSQEDATYADDFTFENAYGLDEVTDDDIEDFLAREPEEDSKPGFLNLPTVAGLATIGVGSVYLLEQLGLFATGFGVSALLGPWLVGVLIILVGFAVLQWSPRKKRMKAAARREAERRRRAARAHPRERPDPPGTRDRMTERAEPRKKAFVKSRTNRKVAGVAGGIGEYFGIDPLLVRIAFVVAFIAGSGVPVALYIALALLMPKDEAPPRPARPRRSAGERSLPHDDNERVITIRR